MPTKRSLPQSLTFGVKCGHYGSCRQFDGLLLSTKNKVYKENKDDNEWTSDDDENDNNEKDSKVKSLISKIEGHDKNKLVKRSKIKLSPKCKASPMHRLSKNKKSSSVKKKSDDKDKDSDDLDDVDEIGRPNVARIIDLRTTATKKSKIGGIIEAFEQNIKGNGASKTSCDVFGKNKLENAFSKLMKSSKGESTPSPRRKRAKRLTPAKPLGMQKLDRWIKKE